MFVSGCIQIPTRLPKPMPSQPIGDSGISLTADASTVNDMVVQPADDEMDVPWIINHPVKVDNVAQVGPKRAPDLGEHSEEILHELGYAQKEIQRLRDDGVI